MVFCCSSLSWENIADADITEEMGGLPIEQGIPVCSPTIFLMNGAVVTVVEDAEEAFEFAGVFFFLSLFGLGGFGVELALLPPDLLLCFLAFPFAGGPGAGAKGSGLFEITAGVPLSPGYEYG